MINIWSCLELGMIFSIVAMGILLTFRVMKMADLTVDASFALGGCSCAAAILAGLSGIKATFLGMGAGALAGVATGVWTLLGVDVLMASILTLTASYSVTLRVLNTSSCSLFTKPTLFSQSAHPQFLLFSIVCTAAIFLWGFLHSHYGRTLRAVGRNPKLAQSWGISCPVYRILALAISGALCGLSGSIFSQMQYFADVSMGTGVVVMGLSAYMLCEIFLPNVPWIIRFFAVVFTSTLYRIAISLALESTFLDLRPSDFNIVASFLLIGVILIQRMSRLFGKKALNIEVKI